MAASGAPAPSGAQFVGVDGLLALCLPFISGFERSHMFGSLMLGGGDDCKKKNVVCQIFEGPPLVLVEHRQELNTVAIFLLGGSPEKRIRPDGPARLRTRVRAAGRLRLAGGSWRVGGHKITTQGRSTKRVPHETSYPKGAPGSFGHVFSN